jgi:hypothetical protein
MTASTTTALSTSYAALWGGRLLKTPEAIRLSGVRRTRLFQLLAGGRIRARRHGGVYLIEGEPLGAYVDGLPAWRPGEVT